MEFTTKACQAVMEGFYKPSRKYGTLFYTEWMADLESFVKFQIKQITFFENDENILA